MVQVLLALRCLVNESSCVHGGMTGELLLMLSIGFSSLKASCYICVFPFGYLFLKCGWHTKKQNSSKVFTHMYQHPFLLNHTLPHTYNVLLIIYLSCLSVAYLLLNTSPCFFHNICSITVSCSSPPSLFKLLFPFSCCPFYVHTSTSYNTQTHTHKSTFGICKNHKILLYLSLIYFT